MEKATPIDVCEEKTYQSIYREHAPSLFRFLVYKSGDEARARDTVQDSFLKLWERCKDVLPEKAKSFLFTLANNAFLNEVRHEKVKLHFETDNTQSDVNSETPQYKMEYDEYKTRLEDAINALPEGQREVFLLNRVENYTYMEMAEMLDVSVKAIEKRMHKALKKLKDLLHPNQG